MGMDYSFDQYEREPLARTPWYRSVWFIFLIVFMVALLAAWLTVARHAAEDIVQTPPQTVLNSTHPGTGWSR